MFRASLPKFPHEFYLISDHAKERRMLVEYKSSMPNRSQFPVERRRKHYDLIYNGSVSVSDSNTLMCQFFIVHWCIQVAKSNKKYPYIPFEFCS